MDCLSLYVKIGVEMYRNEVNKILRENGFKWSDFETEEEAYIWAAETKYNEGLGCEVEVLDDDNV